MELTSLTPDVCYEALKAHDARFDGRFFVGVSSTGIYCRPICRVRLPRRENCSFHTSAAAAEAAGFRPCLRCRPELAPGFAATEARATLACAAARLIEERLGENESLSELAARVGVSDRHLRRIFVDEFGVSPVQYAQTQRLLLAKRLLTDTALPVTTVAYASGFTSVRRMNALFAERYGFAPTRLRTAAAPDARTALEFLLPYRSPYDFRAMLDFFARRTVPGVESVLAEGAYRRTLRLTKDDGSSLPGWLEVTQDIERRALRLRLAPELACHTTALIAATRRVFDVATDPDAITAVLGELAVNAPGLRLPGAYDGFELAVRAILGQQVTVAAARTLATRFATRFGTPLETPFVELTHLFPLPAAVAQLTRDDIASLGIVGARAEAIIALARAMSDGELRLASEVDPEVAMAALQAIRGVGAWTAQYIAMRALAWPDAWLDGDVALLNALGAGRTAREQRAVAQRAEAWRPWRSYAVLHLWRQLGVHTKENSNEA
jgi:AraC family transcriptional regulator of adaptative response / DNA-3-methyladenine glycosylase II